MATPTTGPSQIRWQRTSDTSATTPRRSQSSACALRCRHYDPRQTKTVGRTMAESGSYGHRVPYAGAFPQSDGLREMPMRFRDAGRDRHARSAGSDIVAGRPSAATQPAPPPPGCAPAPRSRSRPRSSSAAVKWCSTSRSAPRARREGDPGARDATVHRPDGRGGQGLALRRGHGGREGRPAARRRARPGRRGVRPPQVYAAPALGAPTAAVGPLSPSLPQPGTLAMPAAYPPRAMRDGTVLIEIELTAAAVARGHKVLSPASAFDSAALETVKGWRFGFPTEADRCGPVVRVRGGRVPRADHPVMRDPSSVTRCARRG